MLVISLFPIYFKTVTLENKVTNYFTNIVRYLKPGEI